MVPAPEKQANWRDAKDHDDATDGSGDERKGEKENGNERESEKEKENEKDNKKGRPFGVTKEDGHCRESSTAGRVASV